MTGDLNMREGADIDMGGHDIEDVGEITASGDLNIDGRIDARAPSGGPGHKFYTRSDLDWGHSDSVVLQGDNNAGGEILEVYNDDNNLAYRILGERSHYFYDDSDSVSFRLYDDGDARFYNDLDLDGTLTSGTVPWGRLSNHVSVNSGNHLTGGGSLSSSRTLDVDAGSVLDSGNDLDSSGNVQWGSAGGLTSSGYADDFGNANDLTSGGSIQSSAVGQTELDTGDVDNRYENVYENSASAGQGWHRIAKGDGRMSGEFTLMDTSCCGHSSINFRAGASFGDNSGGDGLSFTLLQNTIHSSTVFERARIVRGDTYDDKYLEVWVEPRDGEGDTQSVEYQLKDLEGSNQWEPVDWEPGNVPEGHNVHEYDITDKLMVVGSDEAHFDIDRQGDASMAGDLTVAGNIHGSGWDDLDISQSDIDQENYYATDVSGSGDGSLDITMSGTSDISTNLDHDHGLSDITDSGDLAALDSVGSSEIQSSSVGSSELVDDSIGLSGDSYISASGASLGGTGSVSLDTGSTDSRYVETSGDDIDYLDVQGSPNNLKTRGGIVIRHPSDTSGGDRWITEYTSDSELGGWGYNIYDVSYEHDRFWIERTSSEIADASMKTNLEVQGNLDVSGLTGCSSSEVLAGDGSCIDAYDYDYQYDYDYASFTGGEGIDPSSITDGDTISVAWGDANDLGSGGSLGSGVVSDSEVDSISLSSISDSGDLAGRDTVGSGEIDADSIGTSELSDAMCGSDQILEFDGTNWVCIDSDSIGSDPTDLTGGDGISPDSITDGDTVNVAWGDAVDLDSDGNVDLSGTDGSHLNWDGSQYNVQDNWVDEDGDTMNGKLTIAGSDGSTNSLALDGHIDFTGAASTTPVIRTPGGGSDRFRIYDDANNQDLMRFNEGGPVEVVNANFEVSGTDEQIAEFTESQVRMHQPLSVESSGPLSVQNGVELTGTSGNTIDSHSTMYLETSAGSPTDIVMRPEGEVGVDSDLSVGGKTTSDEIEATDSFRLPVGTDAW